MSDILDTRGRSQMEGGASFSLGHRLYRVAWGIAWALLARWTPPPLHGWRRLLLRAAGARIGRGVRVYGSASIWYPPNLSMADFSTIGPRVNCYCQGAVRIGTRAIVSQGAHLCAGTHDHSDPDFQLIVRPIAIGEDAWVAAEAFVGPGVTIGEGAVLGARAVAMRDCAAWTVHSGNPAVAIKPRILRGRDQSTATNGRVEPL